MREKKLLDYHYEEIIGNDMEKIKKKKKILSRIKRILKRNYTF